MKLAPSPFQKEFLSWEFGVFFHFGIRSFYPGHRDWDGLPMPAEGFNPSALDCRQWCRAVREAGGRYAILTCKHHDGFANWPSAYTSYSVAATPWKDGKGDVVREFTDACRAEGLKVGLYYSPAQWGDGAVSFKEDREYDDYFINQISELLTGYGKIDYLWFDGCGSEGHEYDRVRIIHTIRTLQPGIGIFGMWDPDTRWVGNEDGYADVPNGSVRTDVDFSMFATEKEKLEGARYIPAECDMKLRDTWFFDRNEDTIKTLPELMGIYEMSVGRGANLLLDIGPDNRGLLPEADVARLSEFGAAIRARYGHPLDYVLEPAGEAGEMYTLVCKEPKTSYPAPLCDRIVLEEDITEGDGIEEFRVYAHLPCYTSKRVLVYRAETVGHKHICAFPAIRSGQFDIEITRRNGKAALQAAHVFAAKE